MLEFIVGLAVLMVPFLVAMAEVYRFEQKARRTIMSAQEASIVRAVQMNRNPQYQVLAVSVQGEIDLMPATQRVFSGWQPGRIRLSRTYHVGSGTGRQ